MRIRWTTRIAMTVGLITLVAGIIAGAGPAIAATARAATAAPAGQVTAPR
jgi:hypothetical protein